MRAGLETKLATVVALMHSVNVRGAGHHGCNFILIWGTWLRGEVMLLKQGSRGLRTGLETKSTTVVALMGRGQVQGAGYHHDGWNKAASYMQIYLIWGMMLGRKVLVWRLGWLPALTLMRSIRTRNAGYHRLEVTVE
jgi:hypothetical protein